MGLSLEDVLEEFENLRICFGEEDMEMALEFKESGTLLERHLGGVWNFEICFSAKAMEMAWESKESETPWKPFLGNLKF